MTTTSYPKGKLNILLLENISEEAIRLFRESGYDNIRIIKGALSEDELCKQIKNVHVLCIRSKTNVTKKVLASASKLLAIGCFCIGTNQVDLSAATNLGVAVFNAPYSNTRSVAELTIGAMIMLIRRIPEKNRLMHSGVWMKESSNSFELRGKTLGIIGYGNIGSQVSVLAESMGMNVVFYDIQKKLPLGNAKLMSSLQDVFRSSDIISVHTPATAANKNFINKKALALCKKGVIFINYARGELVDFNDLKQAMDNGLVGGAALDVYKDEPEKNGDPFSNPLCNMPNVLLTPHVGGSTEEAQANIGVDVSEKLIQFVETGTSFGSHTIPSLSLLLQEQTHRVLHIHRNIPGVLSAINTALSDKGINIVGQYLKTNETVGYVVLDINKELSKKATELLKDVKGTIKVRLVY